MTTLDQTVSVAELKRAIEGRDAEALTAMYADDAELRIIDHDNPPSRPRELKGKREIASYYDDVCGRAMSHRIDPAFATADAVSFGQTCTYPDGTKVYCTAILELNQGKIVRQVSVQAWDS
ncbi:MAG TPA: nuclear transport factor 2 family protein [Acetobacteraceae bacterium]|jgi:ketosteroid isomerase-like protein|nr:nuclear transport factor 2 family protein [Acetobacteraceae bacterium]